MRICKTALQFTAAALRSSLCRELCPHFFLLFGLLRTGLLLQCLLIIVRVLSCALAAAFRHFCFFLLFFLLPLCLACVDLLGERNRRLGSCGRGGRSAGIGELSAAAALQRQR